jgi:hypothetical protein
MTTWNDISLAAEHFLKMASEDMNLDAENLYSAVSSLFPEPIKSALQSANWESEPVKTRRVTNYHKANLYAGFINGQAEGDNYYVLIRIDGQDDIDIDSGWTNWRMGWYLFVLNPDTGEDLSIQNEAELDDVNAESIPEEFITDLKRFLQAYNQNNNALASIADKWELKNK